MRWRKVNIRTERYDEIHSRAATEGRSVSNMLDRILEDALTASTTGHRASGDHPVAGALGGRDVQGSLGSSVVRPPNADLTTVKPDPRRK